MREKIFALVDGTTGENGADYYDYGMIAVIVLSLIPLAFKQTSAILNAIDKITVVLFIIDYLLRWWTADLLLKRGGVSFLMYPFTFMAIIDLLCILPSFAILSTGFRVLKVLRLLRALRVFRAAKLLRYSKSLLLIVDVIRDQKAPLLAVLALAIGYILISALVVFNVEPETFDSFFEAVYWAAVSLSTVGYGDIYPITSAGRVITMLSSFFGIAVVALPSGIITAGYMERLKQEAEEKKALAEAAEKEDRNNSET